MNGTSKRNGRERSSDGRTDGTLRTTNGRRGTRTTDGRAINCGAGGGGPRQSPLRHLREMIGQMQLLWIVSFTFNCLEDIKHPAIAQLHSLLCKFERGHYSPGFATAFNILHCVTGFHLSHEPLNNTLVNNNLTTTQH